MATLFIILILVSIFHFIYESILLPMFRLELRYKLFKLRDKLRNLKSENDEKIDDNVFYLLEDTICTVINRLPFLSISSKIDASKEFDNNSSFRKRVQDRNHILETCDNEKIRKINEEIMNVLLIAFFLNAGGWILILLPILLIALTFAFITSKVAKLRQFLIKGLDKLTFASDNDFGRFTHA